MRLVETLPVEVREWVTDLKDSGVSPTVIRSCFAILSAIFTTAFNDQLTAVHPCRGVKTPRVPKKTRAIVTPAQFEEIYTHLTEQRGQAVGRDRHRDRAALGRTHRTVLIPRFRVDDLATHVAGKGPLDLVYWGEGRPA